MKKLLCIKAVSAFVLALIFSAASAFAAPWSFGVMGDTQWTTTK